MLDSDIALPDPRQAKDLPALERQARRVRATCVQMARDGGEGHLSSALSCVDILVALFNGWLRVSPELLGDPKRDRFLFSKGHACTAYYAVLAEHGFIEPELLRTYAKSGSALINHPCRHALPLLDMSSGSLGHGLGMATGMLYGQRLSGGDARAAVLMSDGECNEGSVWEAAMFAATQGLDRLAAIVDYNGLQAVGRSDEIMGGASLEAKFKAFGWAASTINGNDIAAVGEALKAVPLERGKPSAIIAKTTGGHGVSFMADQTLWHYRVPSPEEVARAFVELGEQPLHGATR